MFTFALLTAVQLVDPLAIVDDPIRTDQNIVHYHIAIDIPDSGSVIRGATSIRYQAVAGTGPLLLDFDRALTVDSVQSDGRPVDYAFPDDTTLRVARWGPPGTSLMVTVYYHGTPTDGLFISKNVHGDRTAFADNWPNRAHHWFPSEDHPSDKATASFAVGVPSGWRAIANGILEGVDSLPGGRTRWWWRTERRIPVYTMVIGAGRMVVSEIGRGGGPSHTLWTFPQDSAFARDVPFARAQQIIEHYARLFGPFPYAKLAHVQSSTRFGGMENSSAIFYAEGGYARRTMRDGVVAHETAHQWFGDAVTEYDWHHLWLSEGFASYFDPVFFQLVGEEGRFRREMAEKKQEYLASNVVDRPVIDTSETDYFRLLNANNYPKGAWILHMLREEVGDSAFFGGVRDYYETYRDSTALSADLLTAMERHAGRSLRWFFEQWLLQPGYPQFQVSWEPELEGDRVRIRVAQVQPERWGTFVLRVPVVVEEGVWTHRTEIVFSRGERTAEITLSGVGQPVRVWLDTGNLLATVETSGSARR